MALPNGFENGVYMATIERNIQFLNIEQLRLVNDIVCNLTKKTKGKKHYIEIDNCHKKLLSKTLKEENKFYEGIGEPMTESEFVEHLISSYHERLKDLHNEND